MHPPRPTASLKRTASAISLPPTPPGTEDLVLEEPFRPPIARRKRIQAPVVGEGEEDDEEEEEEEEDDPYLASPSRTVRRAKGSEGGSGTRQGQSMRVVEEDDDNPFLVKKGEKVRRPSPSSEDRNDNRITYVLSVHFSPPAPHIVILTAVRKYSRGKRIQYEAPDDIVLPGETPFAAGGGIKPRLLFPAPPSPPPARPTFIRTSSSSQGFGMVTPDVDEDMVMRTPVKKVPGKGEPNRKFNPLPTPQSRPRPLIR